MERQKVIILLPSLNESKSIANVIDSVPVSQLNDMGFDVSILVTDGGSTDGTQQIVANKNCSLYECVHAGKGYQVKRVFYRECDYLIMLDSDGTYPPEYIIQLIKRLSIDLCDVIIGYRIYSKGSMSILHVIGNKLLTALANSLYKIKTVDLCTGYWGFNKKALSLIEITSDGFDLEANLFTEVNKHGLRFGKMPILYLPRIGKGHLNWKHGFTIASKLIKEKFE